MDIKSGACVRLEGEWVKTIGVLLNARRRIRLIKTISLLEEKGLWYAGNN